MTINAKVQAPAEGTSAQRIAGPPSERLAARIAAHQATPPSLLDDLTRLDLATYRAIAETPTPTLDEPLRRLSDVVGYARVHTGVHYPGDVIVGSFIGTAIGESVAYAARRSRFGGQ